MSEVGKIFGAMARVMAEVGAIGKDQKNQQQGYKYRGVDDVMDRLHGILVKNGIFLAPRVVDNQRTTAVNKNGTTLNYSIMTMEYTFIADDGSSVPVTVVGEGMDSGDKATNKAMSVAYKYAMFQTFCIPFNDGCDPDAESPMASPVNGVELANLISKIGEECKRITNGMNASEKNIFAVNCITPVIGQANYTKCKDISKLAKLLEDLKEVK